MLENDLKDCLKMTSECLKTSSEGLKTLAMCVSRGRAVPGRESERTDPAGPGRSPERPLMNELWQNLVFFYEWELGSE